MTWIVWALLALLAVTAILAGLAAYGAARWAGKTRGLLARLESTRLPSTASHYSAQEVAHLPAPVARYFRTVLKDGQPIISAVSVEHTGSFNLSATGEQWKPFRSVQRVITRRPGFVWDARIAMAPGVGVYVHDAYVGGEGILAPAILGLLPLAGGVGAHDLARAEFMRFFAEAAWYPTALLPSQGVCWQAVDAQSAIATLVDGAVSASMLVSFNQAGLIESVRIEARAAVVGKTVVFMPWEGRWFNYQRHNDMLVPLSGEAAWLHADGRRPYWRGSITTLAYEF
ncbi:DUF6544 family protein [Undibacterium sp. TS12]|uniref:DUF6920 family protein n=1 Tax=Undibacterium sp. TS12 TaxID=2908202 RepID=UPI001F4CA421|nr:DUF6544 family protein [Undibacterium sp. TS12]MCH8618162.1 hypothetical protein [Undibacterium sp. TS12]